MEEKTSRSLAFIPSLLLLALPTHAHAARDSQKLVYEVYAGGIHAVQARLTIDIDQEAKRYDIVLDAETRGLLGKVVPWEGVFESHGWIMPDGLYRPERHQSVTGLGDEKDIKKTASCYLNITKEKSLD